MAPAQGITEFLLVRAVHANICNELTYLGLIEAFAVCASQQIWKIVES
jgi:hypothetical protein